MLCVVGCASSNEQVAQAEFWNPTDQELAELEPVIQKYVYMHLSDQRPALRDIPEVEVNTGESNGQITINVGPAPSLEPPAELTIQRISLQSYRRECLGTFEKTGRRLTIAFFDPKAFPENGDGPSVWMDGGFPHFFTITVDMNTKEVIEHYASRA